LGQSQKEREREIICVLWEYKKDEVYSNRGGGRKNKEGGGVVENEMNEKKCTYISVS
jgi:hypothetical protein